MAYEEKLARRVRSALEGRAAVAEKKMFGGLAFVVGGHMAVGVQGQDLMLRLGADAAAAALERKHVRPMDFTGRPLRGMVYVAPAGLRTQRSLQRWVDAAADFAESLPPKRAQAGEKRARVSEKSARNGTRPTRMASTPSSAFDGFSKQTLAFLRGLERNNHREHFQAHRDDYEAHYLRPAMAFVSAVGPRLSRVSKSLHFEPRVNGSVFRLQRDVRFARDKSPYRPTLDLFFWEGQRRGWDASSLFFRLAPRQLTLGVGMHRFDKPAAVRFRQAVIEPRRGPALQRAIAKVEGAGDYAVKGATRKRVPRGFDANHPRAALLLHDGLYAVLEEPVPACAFHSEFAEYCVRHFEAMAPLHRWLLALG